MSMDPRTAVLRDIVPQEFYRPGNTPVAKTVMELQKQLSRLPPWLPLKETIAVSVARISREDPCVCFEECNDGGLYADDEEDARAGT